MSGEENKTDSHTVSRVSGGGALGCASLFAALAVMFIWAAIFPPTHSDAASVIMPGLSFIGGNILAFVAINSRDPFARRAGKLALRILWLSLGVLTIIGFTRQYFFTRPLQ